MRRVDLHVDKTAHFFLYGGLFLRTEAQPRHGYKVGWTAAAPEEEPPLFNRLGVLCSLSCELVWNNRLVSEKETFVTSF